MDDCAGTRMTRDMRNNSASTIYHILPSCMLEVSAADPSTIPKQPSVLIPSSSVKRESTLNSEEGSCPTISLNPYRGRGYWTNTKFSKRGRCESRQEMHMEMHQSTCLNLDFGFDNTTESDFWILPDFDEWELKAEASQQLPRENECEWATLLRRAANSNRERLRRRLEGDGWDFVGGRYGEDERALQATQEVSCASEWKVDEEFDVVVLPVVAVAY